MKNKRIVFSLSLILTTVILVVCCYTNKARHVFYTVVLDLGTVEAREWVVDQLQSEDPKVAYYFLKPLWNDEDLMGAVTVSAEELGLTTIEGDYRMLTEAEFKKKFKIR